MNKRPRLHVVFALGLAAALSSRAAETVDSASASDFLEFSAPEEARAAALSPTLDGVGDDPAWTSTAERPINGARLALLRRGGYVYAKVIFPAAVPHTEHLPWRWDPKTKGYVPGPETEDAVALVFSTPDGSFSDLWVWRAGRTDPAGLADDMALRQGLDGRPIAIPDTGRAPWSGRYPGLFVADTAPRFYRVPASGSRADVRAKGLWENGKWTVEFRRRVRTGHPDDLTLRDLARVRVEVIPDYAKMAPEAAEGKKP